MGFGHTAPKCHLSILTVVSLRTFLKWQKRKSYSDLILLLCPTSLKQVVRLPCGRSPPRTRRRADILITRGIWSQEICTNEFVRLTLILLVTPPFTALCTKPFSGQKASRCSHFFRFSFSNEGSHIHVKFLKKYVCSSSVNLFFVTLIFRPSQGP